MVAPLATGAKRSNPRAIPAVGVHVVPYEIIKAFVNSLYDEVMDSDTGVVGEIPIGLAKSGVPAIAGPKVGISSLSPSAGTLGANFQTLVGASGDQGEVAAAIVEGAFDYFLANAEVQFDPLVGYATATGSIDSVHFDDSGLESRIGVALLATGYFTLGDAGMRLTPQMQTNFVEKISEVADDGVEGVEKTGIVWTGVVDPSPLSNPSPIFVNGGFE